MGSSVVNLTYACLDPDSGELRASGAFVAVLSANVMPELGQVDTFLPFLPTSHKAVLQWQANLLC